MQQQSKEIVPPRSYPQLNAETLPAPVRPISFVCVRFSEEYEHNILKSTCVLDPLNQLIVTDNRANLFFPSLGAALCHGIEQARHELVALIHEDVLLQDGWQSRFEASLAALEAKCPDWGMVGPVGWTAQRRIFGHWSDPNSPTPRNHFTDTPFAEMRRLDEHFLVLHRSRGIFPDPDLPSIHDIGNEMVARLKAQSLKTFAIDAPTIHKYADARGRVIQSAKDSSKIMSRRSLTFQAAHHISRAYTDHKHGLDRGGLIPEDPGPRLDADRRRRLDAPLILLGRGGGGTRLVSVLAQDCGYFIGNEVNRAGDCLDMVPAIYRSVLRRLQCTDDWSRGIAPAELRTAAATMLETAEWPARWGFKLPESALILPDLRRAFPNARFVHFHRNPEDTVFRRSHMTARLDNEIGRASLAAAYDHVGRPREAILTDETPLHMAATTRHQNDLIRTHQGEIPTKDWLELRFEDTLCAPADTLAQFARFCGVTPVSYQIQNIVDPGRSRDVSYLFSTEDVSEARRILGLPPRSLLDHLSARVRHRKRLKGGARQSPPGAGARNVLVLGMHRSGTSCLTGCLEAAGLFLGETAEGVPDNPKGNKEIREVHYISDEVLKYNGGTWRDPPADPVFWTEEHRRRRDALLASFPADRVFGLKDPRILLIPGFWLEHLAPVRMVASYRHPLAVARSLHAREGIPIEDGLALWAAYNRRLLDLKRRFCIPLVRFGKERDAYLKRIERLAHWLRLPKPEEAGAFFEANLIHNKDGNLNDDLSQYDPAFAALFADLNRHAARPLWRDRLDALVGGRNGR